MDSISALAKTVETLRGPSGCPWDKAQTIDSLTPYILEEAYELVDAIKVGTQEDIVEECGDVLLQVMLISQIASESQKFTIDDVARQENKKMIDRHPHVFGEIPVDTVEDVLVNWEKNKEKKYKKKNDQTLFSTIPKSLPALIQAEKIQKKVVNQGFDWDDERGAVDKVHEELDELINVINTQEEETAEVFDRRKKMKQECGDLLFSVVNVIRKCGFQAEDVLLDANEKFKNRYEKAIELADEKGLKFEQLALDEKERYWQRAKQLELR